MLVTLAMGYSGRSSLSTIRDLVGIELKRSADAMDLVGRLNTSLANARFAQRGVILYSQNDETAEAENRFCERADLP